MRISGLQKLTLLDFPQVVSCIVFTQGCNFRCPFCHNSTLVEGEPEEEISAEEIFEFLKKRKGLLDGVVITGGEPLIQKDIRDFAEKLKEMGYLVKLDTNGTNPQKLKELVEAKLIDYVAMDIKNSPEGYEKATGVATLLDKITESKEFLLKATVPYEFRTTVVKGIHTKENLISLAEWIKGAEQYFLQQYKDSGSILSPTGLSPFSEAEMKEFLSEILPIIPTAKIKNL